MFYSRQDKFDQDQYKQFLKTIGSLSNLFSNSETPYLSHSNAFVVW